MALGNLKLAIVEHDEIRECTTRIDSHALHVENLRELHLFPQQRTIEYTNYERTPMLRNAIATPAIDTRWMSRPVATARSV